MSLASNLNPIFQVGKSSLTPELTAAIGESFNNNELIKIGVLKNCFDDPRAIAEMVAERTHSQVVQVIGKKIVLYKPDKDKPKIESAAGRACTGGGFPGSGLDDSDGMLVPENQGRN